MNDYPPTKRWETLTKLKGRSFHSAKTETKIVEKSQVVLFRIFEEEKRRRREEFRERERRRKCWKIAAKIKKSENPNFYAQY